MCSRSSGRPRVFQARRPKRCVWCSRSCTPGSIRPPDWCSRSTIPTSAPECRSVSSGRCLPDLRPAPFGTGVSRPVVLVSHLLALGLYGVATALALAPLALAFIAAALYLLQFRELKSKRFGQVFRLFPPLERLDRLNHLSLVMGFPTVTLGVLLGFGLRYAGGVPVDAAQIVWGMLTWLVLGWAVGVRVVRHWAGRRAAFASIAGFVAVVLVYLALKLAAPGTERFL